MKVFNYKTQCINTFYHLFKSHNKNAFDLNAFIKFIESSVVELTYIGNSYIKIIPKRFQKRIIMRIKILHSINDFKVLITLPITADCLI